jgi:hypothetical protein
VTSELIPIDAECQATSNRQVQTVLAQFLASPLNGRRFFCSTIFKLLKRNDFATTWQIEAKSQFAEGGHQALLLCMELHVCMTRSRTF